MHSYVRSISSCRHWTSTWIVTSSGIRSSSISWRMKSKSGWLADGKPTSISLNPISTTASNIRRLRTGSIGSISAWLPSRRSTEHHRGAWSMIRCSARCGRGGRGGRRLGTCRRPSGGERSGAGPWVILVVGAGGRRSDPAGAKMKNPPAGRCGGRANAMIRRSPYVSRRRPARNIGEHPTPPTGREQRATPDGTSPGGRPTRVPPAVSAAWTGHRVATGDKSAGRRI